MGQDQGQCVCVFGSGSVKAPLKTSVCLSLQSPWTAGTEPLQPLAAMTARAKPSGRRTARFPKGTCCCRWALRTQFNSNLSCLYLLLVSLLCCQSLPANLRTEAEVYLGRWQQLRGTKTAYLSICLPQCAGNHRAQREIGLCSFFLWSRKGAGIERDGFSKCLQSSQRIGDWSFLLPF